MTRTKVTSRYFSGGKSRASLSCFFPQFGKPAKWSTCTRFSSDTYCFPIVRKELDANGAVSKIFFGDGKLLADMHATKDDWSFNADGEPHHVGTGVYLDRSDMCVTVIADSDGVSARVSEDLLMDMVVSRSIDLSQLSDVSLCDCDAGAQEPHIELLSMNSEEISTASMNRLARSVIGEQCYDGGDCGDGVCCSGECSDDGGDEGDEGDGECYDGEGDEGGGECLESSESGDECLESCSGGGGGEY
jgi:hypothetical protein